MRAEFPAMGRFEVPLHFETLRREGIPVRILREGFREEIFADRAQEDTHGGEELQVRVLPEDVQSVFLFAEPQEDPYRCETCFNRSKSDETWFVLQVRSRIRATYVANPSGCVRT